MILIIADTKTQADYWIARIKRLHGARFLPTTENTAGLCRGVTIFGVGPCSESTTKDLIWKLRSRGFSVTYLTETME